MIESWIAPFYQLLSRFGYQHPVHPAVVHVPIGMLVGSFIFGWLAILLKKDPLARSARHCLVLAFVFWFPAALLGVLDWLHIYKGAWLTPVKVKLALCGILFFLLLTALILNFKKEGATKAILAVYTLGLFNVILLGFFGAQLVYGKPQEITTKRHEAGKKIFSDHCLVCHPGGGNIINPSRPITNSPKLNHLDTFIAWIRKPASPMPRFTESEISARQAEGLYDYLSNDLKESSARTK
jgi:uncharacterized membrane protein